MKYLFKYIYKGHDIACITIGTAIVDDNNGGVGEIKQYRDARWVTPPKALWEFMGSISARTTHLSCNFNFIYRA
jgi:hypothetical protein